MVVATTERDPALDVTRALAISGVVLMNYHFFLNGGGVRDPIRSWWLADLLDPMTGVLTTRFAATFVVVAGIGAALFVRAAVESGDRTAIARRRTVLLRRGLLLYGVGAVLEWVWPGTILFFYGAYFMLAALVCTWSSRRLTALAAGIVVGAAALAWWRLERAFDGASTAWLSPEPDGVRNLAIRTFVSHTHPVLPWFGFFLVGMLIGRNLERVRTARRRVAAGALGAVALAHLARTIFTPEVRTTTAEARLAFLVSTDPFDRGVAYSISAVATAVLAVTAVAALVERARSSRLVATLARAGRLSLTVYLGHIAVFTLAVDALGLQTGGGPTASIVVTLAYVVPAIALAAWWNARHGTGPIERIYRAVGG